MKTTLSWLKTHLETSASLDEIVRTLVMRGGFGADEVSISHIMLPFGVKGLLVTLRKCP